MNLEHMFVSFQDFVGKTRNFSAGVVARFGREEGYIEHGILTIRGNLTLKICSLVNCYSLVKTELLHFSDCDIFVDGRNKEKRVGKLETN